MSADQLFWISLLAKLLLTAGIVVTASVVAERAGPLVGGLIATLPVTVGPAYIFLSLDHDASYVAAAARSGLAVNAVTGVFMLVYATLAQKRGLLICVSGAVASWIAFALLARSLEWTLPAAALVNLLVFPVFIWLSRSMVTAEIPRLPRAWYDLPMRTLLVCTLMTALLLASNWAGPNVTGIIAVYPISTTSLMLILQPRVGGRAAAAVFANSLWGLCGVAIALAELSLAIEPYGAVPAFTAALAIIVAWNLMIWRIRRTRGAAIK